MSLGWIAKSGFLQQTVEFGCWKEGIAGLAAAVKDRDARERHKNPSTRRRSIS